MQTGRLAAGSVKYDSNIPFCDEFVKQLGKYLLTMTFKNAKIIKTGADGCLRKGWTYEYSDTSYRGKKG